MDDQNTIPGPPAITDLFAAGVEADLAEKEEKRKKFELERFPLSPSQFGGCGRNLAIDLAEFCGLKLYKKEMLNSRATKKFSRGHTIEYSLLRQFGFAVPSVKQSHKQQVIHMADTPDGKYVIGGSIDALLSTPDGNMIMDVKSKGTFYSVAYSDKFREEFEEIGMMEGVEKFGTDAYYIHDIDEFFHNFDRDNFLSGYFLQLNAYGAAPWSQNYKNNLFPDHRGICAVSLYFENKNNHQDVELRWAPSQTLYKYAVDRMQAIYKWVAIDKKDPLKYPTEYILGSLRCKLCARKENCWPGEKHPWIGPKKRWGKDTFKLKDGAKLEEVYKKFKPALNSGKVANQYAAEIMALMEEMKVNKVTFSDGFVYEMKFLKSPKPHTELRRSK